MLLAALVVLWAPADGSAAPTRAEVIRRENAKFFVNSRKKLLRRDLTCNFSRRQPALGFVISRRGARLFQSLSRSELREARKRRLDNICPAVCASRIRSVELETLENTATRLTPAMLLPLSCDPRASLEVVDAPTLGRISAITGGLQYLPPRYATGVDRVRIRFKGSRNSATANITISRNAGSEFVGDPLDIGPYRATLTANEVNHLLQKVGADSDARLRQIGLTQGRAALVEAILNYQSTDLNAVDATSLALAERYDYYDVFCYSRNYWHSASLRAKWLAQMLKGNPLKKRMMLFWHHHFATNLAALQFSHGCASNWFPREHFEILGAYALGSFDSLMRAMRDDPAMAVWLNNSQNQYRLDIFQQSPAATTNDNFGRELMELFTIGRADRFNQSLAYYTEDDVKQAALGMTGQFVTWNSGGSTIAGTNGWYNGDGVVQSWDLSRSFRGRLSMFSQSGVGVLNRSVIDRDTLVDHLLYDHPGTARNLAFKLIGYFGFPQSQGDNIPLAEQAPTNAVAESLIANRYEVVPALRLILNSALMFAPQSKDSCIQSPTEQIISAARRIGLPLTVLELQALPWQRESAFADSINRTGHAIVDLPNVFAGQKQCGASLDPQRSHGEGWLEDQSLFNRLRAIARILDFSLRGPNADFWQNGAGVKLKETLLDGMVNPTAAQVIERLEARFEISLNGAQRRRILNTINPISAPWNAAPDEIKERRLAQVTLALVAVFPQFIMR
jgi:hypothetical protein